VLGEPEDQIPEESKKEAKKSNWIFLAELNKGYCTETTNLKRLSLWCCKFPKSNMAVAGWNPLTDSKEKKEEKCTIS